MFVIFVKKNRWPLLLLILATPFILAFRFLLQELPDSFDALGDILIWIFAGGGGMWLTGKVVALLLENWAYWHTISPGVKRIFVIIISGTIAVVAETVYVSGLLDMISPTVSMVILAMINWMFSQKQYMEIKEGPYGASARKSKFVSPGPAG